MAGQPSMTGWPAIHDWLASHPTVVQLYPHGGAAVSPRWYSCIPTVGDPCIPRWETRASLRWETRASPRWETRGPVVGKPWSRGGKAVVPCGVCRGGYARVVCVPVCICPCGYARVYHAAADVAAARNARCVSVPKDVTRLECEWCLATRSNHKCGNFSIKFLHLRWARDHNSFWSRDQRMGQNG